jgi:hypothetical protein
MDLIERNGGSGSFESASSTKRTGFFSLPLELHQMIYSYLLINPILADPKCLTWEHRLEHLDQYYLYPEILRTCRQINKNASDVLYGLNTFVLVCRPGKGFDTPLKRYRDSSEQRKQHTLGWHHQFDTFAIKPWPAIKQVRRWRVIVVCKKKEEAFQDFGLVQFSQAISLNPPNSLQILITPKLLMASEVNTCDYRRIQVDVLFSLIRKPFSILRNIGRFTVEGEGWTEVLNFSPERTVVSHRSSIHEMPIFDILPKWCIGIKALMEGNSPVKPMFGMYEKLIAYGQAFERNKVCRDEMRMPFGTRRPARETHRSALPEGLVDLGYDPEAYSDYWHVILDVTQYNSPFECKAIEKALKLAQIASEQNNLAAFRIQRGKLIQALNPRRQRIYAAAASIVEFIEGHKVRGGMFDPRMIASKIAKIPIEELKIADDLLEKFSDSFSRRIPADLLQHVWNFRMEVYFKWQVMSQNMLQEEARYALYHNKDSIEFIGLFKSACEELYEQYLEIQRTWADLLQDSKQTGGGVCINSDAAIEDILDSTEFHFSGHRKCL